MIEITTIGSGSSGNCYILKNTSEDGFVERLIIEAGVPFNSVQKALKFDLRNISGCLVSHEHGDHAAFVKFYHKYKIPIYATGGTLKEVGLLETLSWNGCHKMMLHHAYMVGKFKVMPFETEHDAAEPCGFLIDCPDGNRVLFATDTFYLRYRFPNITIFMLECNYDKGLLLQNIKNGSVHPSVAERVRKSHMSINQCIDTLRANDLSKVKAIVLIHLSEQNGMDADFTSRVEKATGKMVHVAKKNKPVIVF